MPLSGVPVNEGQQGFKVHTWSQVWVYATTINNIRDFSCQMLQCGAAAAGGPVHDMEEDTQPCGL